MGRGYCWRRYVAALFVLALSPGMAIADPANPDSTALAESMAAFDRQVRPFLKRHCTECHGAQTQEGDLALHKLDPNMNSSSAARWAMVVDYLARGKMPPEDRPRPGEAEIHAITAWIKAEMKRTGKHLERRAAYENGNVLPHELLFDRKDPPPVDAPVRVRRISPHIYESFTSDVGKNARGVGQPFSPPGGTTFADMGAPAIDEPITVQLLRNALAIVQSQSAWRVEKDGSRKWTGARELQPLFDPDNTPDEAAMATAIRWEFGRVVRREPTEDELRRFTKLMQQNIADSGRETGIRYALAAVFLLPDAVFRWEIGNPSASAGQVIRLQPREIAFALAYALTDKGPDDWLLKAAADGELDSQEGVASAVRRMLDDPRLERPRIMRFFREYFEYPAAVDVFKLKEDFSEHEARILVADTEQLVEYILAQDRQVLRELLTTNKSFVNYRYDSKAKSGVRARDGMHHLSYSLPPDWKWTPDQPVELPGNQRAGILTQPAWLVAHSKSDENHAIIRGKWVRERLLGGVVPDIPITVDAQLPEDPDKTLRERMGVTREAYCWQCHRLMNRVGLPFEMYDHFGRFRTRETGRPVDASGGFEHTGDSQLTGDTSNAIDFVRRMADSPYVEQVFVRHAFRYWMGRNETPGDAASLQAAHRAYRENDGSMRALIESLLSSESFLYRVTLAPAAGEEE